MLIQNGVAEQAIQTTENSVHVMIKKTELPIKFWVQAVETDVYLHNHTAIRLIIDGQSTTSEKAFTESKPFINHICVWECKCYFFVDSKSLSTEDRQDKFMNHERVRVFMNYIDETMKQYWLWVPDLKHIIRSHAVKFAENKKGESVNLRLQRQTSNTLSEWKLVEWSCKKNLTTLLKHSALQSFLMPDMNNSPALTEVSIMSEEAELTGSDPWVQSVSAEHSKEISMSDITALCESVSSELKMVKQFLWVEILKRQQKDDDSDLNESATKVSKIMLTLTALETDNAQSISTSLIYVKAVEDFVWGEMWKNAIKAELTALAANDTWKEIVSFKNVNIITSKWVFKLKMHINDSLDKLKARVVAREFSQMHSINYEDIFVSTVKFDTLCMFLVLIALENLKCHQVNVNNAFTESFLKKIIYMTSSSDVDVTSDHALHILCSLYSLKQTARNWHKQCVTELVKMEFHQSDVNPCLLLHSQKHIMLLLYVDDIVIVSAAISAVIWFKQSLAAAFKVKDLKEMQKILDIWIICNHKRQTLHMNQTHYVEKMLQDFHMKTDKHKCTEISLNRYDALCSAGSNDQRIDQRQYQQTIESLMYTAIHTCLNIFFVLDWLSQYLSDSVKHHEQALKKLLQYIQSTVNLEIMYGLSESQNLVEYSDSDYASDKLDQKSILGHVYMLEKEQVSWTSQKQKSILGHVYMLEGGPVSWASQKQKSVTTSTIKTEYMTMSMCTKTEVWLTQILRNMKLDKYFDSNSYCASIQENETHKQSSSLQLKRNNQAVLTLIKDVHVHERSKHIDVTYHHIWDLHQRNQIEVNFVPSQDMIADGLMKSLSRQNFKNFVNQLGLESSGSQ